VFIYLAAVYNTCTHLAADCTAEVGSKRLAFEKNDPNGWSRGDKLELLSLGAQTGCVLLSAVCYVIVPVGVSSAIIAISTISCVLLPVGYTVYILADEWRAHKHGEAAAVVPTIVPEPITESTSNPLGLGLSPAATMAANHQQWATGSVVDIETEDGYERNSTILGPATSGDPNERQVQFADGVVDDWPVADFMLAISAGAVIEHDGAVIEHDGVTFGVVDDISEDESDEDNRSHSSIITWTCTACTVVHEGPAKAVRLPPVLR